MSFKFLSKVLSDCKYLWRTMQLLDQGFIAFSFFSTYSLYILCISLLLPCQGSVCSLEQGSCFCLCSPNHKVLVTLCPQQGTAPRETIRGKPMPPAHNSVTTVLWDVSCGRTFLGSSTQPTVNVTAVEMLGDIHMATFKSFPV